MKIYKYIISFLLIISINLGISLNAQEWTEPVNVSDLEGHDYEPDIAIDSNTNLHAVWTHKIESNFYKIYYSKSENQGQSWIEPVDFSENSNFWFGNPHIVAGNENSLFISYEKGLGNPDQTMVYLHQFDGIAWGDTILISENMPGSDHSFLTLDKTGKLYVFWLYSDSKFYYRCFENNILSDIYATYDDDLYFIDKCVSDNLNNLHCVGSSTNLQLNCENITYYFYNVNTLLWTTPEILNEQCLYIGNDIAMDTWDFPNLIWHERIDPGPPYNDATFYSSFNGISWTIPELVVEDPWEQRLLIDENNIKYIFEREKTPTGSQLVEYIKNEGEWEGYKIDTAGYSVGSCQPAAINNVINILYRKQQTAGETGDIWFSKSDISTEINKQVIYTIKDFKVFPNPFSNKATISFETTVKCNMNLYIIDLLGNLIKSYHQGSIKPGKYEFGWDGISDTGVKIPSGLYLVRLSLNECISTKSVKFIN